MTPSRSKTLFALLLLAIASYGQTLTSVAVLPSDGTAISNDELEALTDEMRAAALKVLPTSSFVLLKQDVVIKRLGGAEAYIKECSESSCIVNLGKKAQVDYVSQASVSKLGKKIRLKVELYNVRTEGLISIYNETAENIINLLDIVKKNVPNEVFSKIPEISGSSDKRQIPKENQIQESSISVGTLTDSRDNKKYKTVKIDNQTWMAENLNYNISGSKCYKNEESYCKKYGRLYDWNTAKNVCPSGWHLPDKEEWKALILTAAVGGEKTGGKHLKAKSGWSEYGLFSKKSGNGLDTYGFAALPGGFVDHFGSFQGIGYGGVWWSATELDYNLAYHAFMRSNDDDVQYFNFNKSSLSSVRCLQD